jgi:hypothetical protein
MFRAGRCLVALSVCLITSYASAQETSEAEMSDAQLFSLERQISELVDMAETEGVVPYESMGGLLSSGETGTMEVMLEEGREYIFVGVCDDNCSDMDFWVFDPDGEVIDGDVGTDDLPAVSIYAEADGVFTIDVDMADCTEGPCAVAMLVFASEE